MVLDIIVVLVVAFGFFAGYRRGLIKTVFDTLSLLIGIIAAMKLSTVTMSLVESLLSTSERVTYLISVVLTFIFVMFVIRFVGRKLEDLFKAANINFFNKLSGGGLQAFFFLFLVSMVVWLLGNYNVLNPAIKNSSVTYRFLEPLPEFGSAVFKAAKPLFQEFWDKTTSVMESMGQQANEVINE